jgi:glutaminyl-peptide cyclotransferase
MSFLVKLVSVFFLSLVFPFSCKQEIKNSFAFSDSTLSQTEPEYHNLSINQPKDNTFYKIGEEISLDYSFKDSAKKTDSVIFRVNGKIIAKQTDGVKSFNWRTLGNLPGLRSVTLTAYYQDSTKEIRHMKVTLLSDIIPRIYTYQVVATYPHDKTAYTQGLLYEEGMLYEGTGLSEQSTLRKENLETGERLKVLNLPLDIFGEGIAIAGKYLYQLTYKNNIAFQYDKNTFEVLNKFNYPMTEGWGLTYDGEYLLMTDGTEKIYFMDPEYFTEVKHIEVYDDKGARDNLNELEYINGEIWANVYTTDTIVIIQPNSGKITGKLVLNNILKPEDYHNNIDYLNGIAYDNEKKRLFVTGKNWPKLFEIKIVKK